MITYSAHASKTMSPEQICSELDRDAFELWFQPIVCLDTLEVRGFEGLARCRARDGSLIPPADFIDAVEADDGIYRRFTLRMIEHAVEFAHRCARMGTAPLVTVNLAEASLRDPTLVEQVEAALRHREIPPGQLVFEITEREFLDPSSAQSGVLQELSALGVGLAIDDFGTGWSSLETLRWLPLSQIKIDRSFLERVVSHTADRIIVEKVIELAQSLHLVVVAEGIERTDQLELLRTAGCDRGQGYLFSRPVEAHVALTVATAGIAAKSDVTTAMRECSDVGPPRPDCARSGEFTVDSDDTCIGTMIERTTELGPLALQVLDILPMPVFIKATDGRIVWSNGSHWRRVGATSRADVLDHRDLELHRVDEALRYRVDDLSVLTTGLPVVDRREVQTRPDGASVELRTSKFAVRNRSGAIVGLVGFYSEVGEVGYASLDSDLLRLSTSSST